MIQTIQEDEKNKKSQPNPNAPEGTMRDRYLWPDRFPYFLSELGDKYMPNRNDEKDLIGNWKLSPDEIKKVKKSLLWIRKCGDCYLNDKSRHNQKVREIQWFDITEGLIAECLRRIDLGLFSPAFKSWLNNIILNIYNALHRESEYCYIDADEYKNAFPDCDFPRFGDREEGWDICQ